ncbi:hypothetical protein AB205_0069000 [Aquarana catesbeiana]|nr:hypothetical protein AB205_0069000 [Aquarana catesbeiana]
MQTVDVDGRTTKKLITNLKPKTHYTFTLTNHGNSLSGLQQNVAVRTAPNMLGVKPLVNAKAQLDGSITVVLPDVEMSESVRHYYIVVVPLRKLRGQFLNPWGSPEEMDLEQLVQTITKQHRRSLRYLRHLEYPKPFVAARFQSLPGHFTLGDQKNYDGFENKALEVGQKYVFFIMAMLESAEVGGSVLIVYQHSPPLDPTQDHQGSRQGPPGKPSTLDHQLVGGGGRRRLEEDWKKDLEEDQKKKTSGEGEDRRKKRRKLAIVFCYTTLLFLVNE